jgi:YfiH family protein
MMITPNWPAPENIHALTLTKDDSIADLPRNVDLRLLQQVHENKIIEFPTPEIELKADGAYTHQANIACTIKTADCLAILICSHDGQEVAALHGGWRGLAQGIIAQGVKKFQAPAQELIAWLSPAICPQHYEVDQQVFNAFSGLEHCFHENRPGHWLCDLYAIARMQLQQAGIERVFGETHCTFEYEEELYSYRRDPTDPGRLLHVIWRR